MSCKHVKKMFGGDDKHYSPKSTVAEEKGRRFILSLKRNELTFCKIKYDKGVFTKEEKRCDYLFAISLNNKIQDWLFVELKGQDIEEAVNQIACTIDGIGTKTFSGTKVSAFVVSSKSPKAARFDIIKAKESFAKKYKHLQASIRSENIQYTHIIK